jgi:UDP:flavonoid glycosyltransferase YjiC (YdhE family)
MIIIPVFGDQPANAKESEIKGYGIHVPFQNITEESLFNAVESVLVKGIQSFVSQ